MTFVRNNDGSITATVDVTFTDAQDIMGTGVGTMTLIIPAGVGAANVAALAQGSPGQPATFRNLTPTQLAPGAAPTAALTLVAPGGAGASSVYDIALGIPQGLKGDQGVAGTVIASVAGTATDGLVVVYDGPSSAPTWKALQTKTPMYAVAGTSFQALSMTSAGTVGVITSTTIAAQSFAYRPRVFADVEITPASTGLRVDTEVRMGTSGTSPQTIAASGQIVARGRGVESPGVAVHVTALPFFGATITPSDSSPVAVVPAGQSQTFTFAGVRQYGSAAWATAQQLGELKIWCDPV